MFSNRRSRRGFTLPEVLVTVAIVAVLAAIVVPAVTSQLAKADAPSLQGSIGSLRTGLTAFVTDVRKFPRRISHLTTAILTTDSALGPQVFGDKGAANWKGPYVSFNIASGDSVLLGMNLYAQDSITKATNMVRLDLTGSTLHSEVSRIDTLIDGATGKDAGNLRWTQTVNAASLIKYFLTSAQ